MAKSKVFWLTRDEDTDEGDAKSVFLWRFRDHPKKNNDGVWEIDKSGEYDMCYRGFKALTGITLAPGQREKARLVIG